LSDIGGDVRRSEWIAAGYFLYLLVPIWLRATPGQRLRIAVWALGLAGAVAAIGAGPVTAVWRVVRDWAPGLYLLAGYWLPGRLFGAPNLRLERWLMRADERWLGSRAAAGSSDLPAAARGILELSYLLCYPLVPVSFAFLYFWTDAGAEASAAADAFWSAVLLAVFLCYGLLPWLPTRPPRALLTRAEPGRSLRGLNLFVLDRASIQVNTFPSGHVAAALAAALAVGSVAPATGLLIGVLAFAIAVAAVAGRYHYLADVVLGALAAVLAVTITSMVSSLP
jgi:hypothetical protein